MTHFPVIVSAPAGAGKTTVVRRLLEQRQDLGKTISATTRARRAHEQDGIDYYFVSPAEFRGRQERGEFAETADVHGEMYGTLRSELDRVLQSGRHVIMEIDVQGARAIRSAIPASALIFILPPSVEALVSRLRNRKTEPDAVIERRLRSALLEIEAVPEYDYVVVNETVDAAAARVSAIIDAETARVSRLHGVEEQVAALIAELRRGMPAHVQENDDASVYPG
jgi:guanylate kinase